MVMTNVDTPSEWVTLSVRVPIKLQEELEEYEREHYHSSRSEVLRMLIALGLKSDIALVQAIRANAEARALHQLSDALDEAVMKFREAQRD